MLIERELEAPIENRLSDRKILILYGPRQVGKTTLVETLLSKRKERILSINADETRFVEALSSRDARKIKRLIEGYELLFIDEAQRIPDIGINLKIIHDQFPEIKVIATGSSSFDLANQIREPLTGRSWTFTLYPVAFLELAKRHTPHELDDILEEALIYGTYPETLTYDSLKDKQAYLSELSASYLYKDILEIAHVKYPQKLVQLLRLLAYQIGSLVSLSELGNTLQISKDTVHTYIDLLEKAFVIWKLSGFSQNLRKEITKMDKIYFLDLGVRNALIENFSPLDLRNDHGQLWENFLMMERLKWRNYSGHNANAYYWRTYTGAELDLIEETSGSLHGFEFKYGKKSGNAPKAWRDNYSSAHYSCIHNENYQQFITDGSPRPE